MTVLRSETLHAPATLSAQLEQVTPAEVERALARSHLDEHDLLCLLSPAAERFLEPMAQAASRVTRSRFGRGIKLYAPLYLSNACTNACQYCGFNRDQAIPRRTLTLDEVEAQANFLGQQGFKSLLLVSGESRQAVPFSYLQACLQRLRPRFPELSFEVYPLEAAEYRALSDAGLYGLALYQETYQPEVYAVMHPAGRKRDFDLRGSTPATAAAAGLRQVGLGALLGLADFRLDGYALGLHARQLSKKYWKTVVGVSFPRLRRAAGGFEPPQPVSDREFVQLTLALRLFLPDSPFSLSTRESAQLRDHLIPLVFTQVSAGSCTAPGGYGEPVNAGEQFEVVDTRSPAEVAQRLVQLGFEPVWKDWDLAFEPVG